VTTTFDAEPDYRHRQPTASIWPFFLALCMAETWIGSVFTPWAVLIGFGLTLLGMLGWGWQSSQHIEMERIDTDTQIVDAE
jgi:cytochrome c oxidase subunit 1